MASDLAQNSGAITRVVHSAQNFNRYYRDLQQGENHLNPIERVVFSLVLSNSKTPEQTCETDIPQGRT